MKTRKAIRNGIFLLGPSFEAGNASAMLPGGGDCTGANVNVVENGGGKVTMGNGMGSSHPTPCPRS